MNEDEFVALIRQVDTDIKFATIAREEAKRTVFCHPDEAERLRWQIGQNGLDDVLTLVESPFVPAGQAYVADMGAIEAATNQGSTRSLRLY